MRPRDSVPDEVPFARCRGQEIRQCRAERTRAQRRCVSKWLALALVVLVVCGQPRRTQASANGRDPVEASRLAAARARLAFERGDFTSALAGFRLALTDSPDPPTVLFNVASSLLELERHEEALVELRALQRIDGLYAELHIAVAEGVAYLTSIPVGRLTVECTIQGVEIHIGSGGGQPCPAAGLSLRAGVVEVVGVAPNGERVRRLVRVTADGFETVRLYFSGQTPSGPGRLGGSVELFEGPLRTRLSDHPMAQRSADVEAPADRFGVLLVGVGLTLLGGGWAFVSEADGAVESASRAFRAYQYEDRPAEVGRYRRAVETANARAETWRAVGYGALGMGASAVVAGTIWTVVAGFDEEPGVVLSAAPGGFVIGGSW